MQRAVLRGVEEVRNYKIANDLFLDLLRFLPAHTTTRKASDKMVRVLICGDLVWAHKECEDLFRGLADVVTMDSPNRTEFFAGLQQPGGKYDGIVGIYRHNVSTDHIGIFDKELIAKLPTSVKWIAHNGAGYDQIDVHACKERSIVVSNTPGAVDDATATTALYLMISALRRFAHAEQDLRANN
uniref:Conserved virulence factor C n=1 Tax=Ganoderma boninense TaxID=34458 RepID=A0A5K1JXE7_9APHY|nr:Conserved virulence factor C [Ganoderma boninense]